jgi:hypothetical protein
MPSDAVIGRNAAESAARTLLKGPMSECRGASTQSDNHLQTLLSVNTIWRMQNCDSQLTTTSECLRDWTSRVGQSEHLRHPCVKSPLGCKCEASCLTADCTINGTHGAERFDSSRGRIEGSEGAVLAIGVAAMFGSGHHGMR